MWQIYMAMVLEIIAGFSDEMFVSTSCFKEGNRERSLDIKDNNKTPDKMARNILASDFNGDGIDDVVFIQLEEIKPWRSPILLCSS